MFEFVSFKIKLKYILKKEPVYMFRDSLSVIIYYLCSLVHSFEIPGLHLLQGLKIIKPSLKMLFRSRMTDLSLSLSFQVSVYLRHRNC